MAWNYTPPAYVGGATLVGNWGTVPVALADFEAIAQDIQHWGGNVDAAGFQLVNLGAFQFRSGTLPASPTIGEIAVDSVTSTPKIWALGSQWAQLAPIELQRTMPGTVNNEVDIGSFVFFSSSVLLISVAIGAISYSVSKFYVLPISFNATNNTWQVAQPVSSSGTYQGAQDFALDVNVNNSTCSLRLRNTLGALTPTAFITIRQDGPTTDVFTAASGTSAVTAPVTVFGSSGCAVAPIILNRTMPVVVNSEVDIGSFTFSNGCSALWISVCAQGSSYSISKIYLLPIYYNGTGGVWMVALPISSSGPYVNTVDFALDININTNVCSLRLRDTANTLAATATVIIHQDALSSDIFVPSIGTSAVTAPTAVFGGGTGAVFSTAFSSVTQSFANGVQAALTFDTNVEDSGGGTVHSTTTNTSRFTIPAQASGRYHVAFGTAIGSVGTISFQGQIRVNGTTIVATADAVSSASIGAALNMCTYLFLNAADYVEFLVYQANGSAQSSVAGRANTWGQILRIS